MNMNVDPSSATIGIHFVISAVKINELGESSSGQPPWLNIGYHVSSKFQCPPPPPLNEVLFTISCFFKDYLCDKISYQ